MRSTFVSLLLALLAAGARAETPTDGRLRLPPRVAIALSGGGARGIAHIGVLRALEDNSIPIDAIAGTSMGALVGAFYASGRRGLDLERVVSSLDWSAIFGGRADRRLLPITRRQEDDRTLVGIGLENWKPRLPAGAMPEYGVNRFLIAHLAESGFSASDDFDRLPIRFRAVAAALDNRDRIVLARGSLPRAVRASLSIPVAFPPVDWHGRTLVDGGVVDNLPTREARAFGAPVVVAVDASSPPLEPERYQDVLGVAAQLSGLLADRVNADYREEADVLIKPDLGRHSFNDYASFEGLIAKGYEAGVAAVPEIRRRMAEGNALVSPTGLAATATGPTLAGRPISEILVDGNRRMSTAAIRRIFNVPIGPPFDVHKALLALDKLHATSLFDHCWLDFEEAGTGLRIILRVREGPRVRAEVGGSYDQAARARGVAKLRRRNAFGFGEEAELTLWASDAGNGIRARLFGERLITPALGFEVALAALTDKPRFYEDGEEINRAIFRRQEATFRVNRAIKRWARLEGGLRIGGVKTNERSGLDLVAGTDAVRTAFGAFTIDDRDDAVLPTAGQLAAVQFEHTLTGLGADRDFWRMTGRAQVARAVGKRGAFEANAYVGLSSGEVPPYELFRLGGPDLVPGRRIDELWGPQALAASVAFRFRTVAQLRAVARIGAGQVFDSRSAVRVRDLNGGVGLGLIYPTRIGPVRVDFGFLEGGRTLVTFAIGMH